MRTWLGWVLVATLASGVVRAAPMSPDEEVARRSFAIGEQAYARGDYGVAIQAWEMARLYQPSPAFDYNIARAYDRLGDGAQAIAVYRRFLAADPRSSGADEARQRIESLSRRLGPQTAAPVEAPPPRPSSPAASRYLAPGLVAGVAGASLVTGAALLGVAAARYGSLRDGCGVTGACAAGEVDAVRRLDIGGKVMLGLGAGLVVSDVVLWVLAARHARPAPR